MPLFFQVLASGSKGNASVVSSRKTTVLIDAGISGKELVRRLDKSPVKANQLNGIIISHEHQDHVRGSGTISRRFHLPVYMSQGTLENLAPGVGSLSSVQIYQTGRPFGIGDLEIRPFSITHDAREPAGFVLEHDGCKLGICTDLGVVTQLVRARLEGCHGLILEANHDVELLMNGPYPPELKQRIRSRHGHLSNEEAFNLLRDLRHEGLQAVTLAHLSEANNRPDLVKNLYKELLGLEEWRGVRFGIGNQYQPLEGVELNCTPALNENRPPDGNGTD